MGNMKTIHGVLLAISIAMISFILTIALRGPADRWAGGLSRLPLKLMSLSTSENELSKQQELVADDNSNRIKSLETELALLNAEIARLRGELGLAGVYGTSVSAEVVGKTGMASSPALIIDKGSDDGLAPGWAVLTDGRMIGQVVRAENRLSWVEVLNHPNSRISAYIPVRDGSLGIVQGLPDGTLELQLIPLNVPLERGDFVMTSSQNLNAPPDILIGSISEIRPDQGGLFHSIAINPGIDYRQVRLVTVLVPPVPSG